VTFEPMDVGRAVERSVRSFRGTDVTEPLLEAQMLVEHATGQSRSWVISHPEAPLDPSTDREIQELVDRRASGEPMAYIVRKRDFYGLAIHVDSRVLIPRPETEIVVEEVLPLVRDHPGPVHIVDVGTGSGAIVLALAANLRSARLTAVDCSRDALDVAALNARTLGFAERIEFVQGDIISWLLKRVDIIVANLPYIPEDSIRRLRPEIRDFEPRIALDGGLGGIEPNRRLLQQLQHLLLPGGHAFLECEPYQIEALRMAASASLPGSDIDFVIDGFGDARFLHVIMPS
jgi:release factor glutamine methyltransferase